MRGGAPAPLIERFLRFVAPSADGCWLWTSSVSKAGYGKICVQQSPGVWRTKSVHRVAYELLVGPIPDGLTLDHTCHTKAHDCPGGPCVHRRCANPDHLEPVTGRENTLRSHGPTAVRMVATSCVNGHEFTPENTAYWQVQRGSGRVCRTCQRERERRRTAARRAAA